jgi:uncharacterized lipoprotein YmbA
MVCEASAGRLAACFAAALALCLSAACSFLPSEPYREVRTFDLGVPEAIGSASALQVQPFGADSACKFKMLYRAEGNEMLIDEYNRWAQPPGQMLTKYLGIFPAKPPPATRLRNTSSPGRSWPSRPISPPSA